MNHHAYTSSFLFFVAIHLFPLCSISSNTLSSTKFLAISNNQTISSPGGIIELGFFDLFSYSRYFGMWYKNDPEKKILWVANRDKPLYNSTGIFKVVDANFVLLNGSNTILWSTNRTGDTRSELVGELFDNGNLVLRESNKNNNNQDGFLWQSFDFPTDTLLPQMKLGWDRKRGLNKILRAWTSEKDPSSAAYTYQLEFPGLAEFFIKIGDRVRMFRSGSWDGTRFSGIAEEPFNYIVHNFTDNNEEAAYMFTMINHSFYSRLSLSPSGILERYIAIPPSRRWNLIWRSPFSFCDHYNACGPNGYCDVNANTSSDCNCIKGFDPKNPQEWDLKIWWSGCVRRTPLSCIEDEFVRLMKIKLPTTDGAIVDRRRISTKECRKRCLENCQCTAFANTDIQNGGWGCVIWTGELMDIRTYAVGGQDLYVRLAASDPDKINPGEERNRRRKIIGSVIGVSIMLFLSLITMFYFWKRKQKIAIEISAPNDKSPDLLMAVTSSSEETNTDDFRLPLMEFKTIVVATDNFSESNKLGQGGFGTVYKGRLLDGQEIAVKRLSKMSSQGTHEFKNEAKLIAKLQHLNLVRLLGCCVEVDEKILIYEYLENLSLDFYLFEMKSGRR